MVKVDGGKTIKGIGVDMVSVERIKKAMERTKGFEDRVFTRKEQDYCGSKADPFQYFAARFAAKEAVMKALGRGLGQVAFNDIEVVSDGKTRPRILLKGSALSRFEEIGGSDVHVSMSHEQGFAIAMVVIS